MKKILNILSFALLLGGCSSFLEEYSQDLAKIEGVEDLDEILLGEAYLPFSAVTDLGNYIRSKTYGTGLTIKQATLPR